MVRHRSVRALSILAAVSAALTVAEALAQPAPRLDQFDRPPPGQAIENSGAAKMRQFPNPSTQRSQRASQSADTNRQIPALAAMPYRPPTQPTSPAWTPPNQSRPTLASRTVMPAAEQRRRQALPNLGAMRSATEPR